MLVFDSSTLILLANCELLDVFLNSAKGVVYIPKAVESECMAKKSFDALLIEKRINERKIMVIQVTNRALCEKLRGDFGLGAGEAEAIALGIEKKALVATDDKNAINACKLLNLRFATAIGFLVRAFEKRLLAKQEALSKLAELSKYGRYSRKIIADAEESITKSR